jgi:hypothetical protein
MFNRLLFNVNNAKNVFSIHEKCKRASVAFISISNTLCEMQNSIVTRARINNSICIILLRNMHATQLLSMQCDFFWNLRAKDWKLFNTFRVNWSLNSREKWRHKYSTHIFILTSLSITCVTNTLAHISSESNNDKWMRDDSFQITFDWNV